MSTAKPNDEYGVLTTLDLHEYPSIAAYDATIQGRG